MTRKVYIIFRDGIIPDVEEVVSSKRKAKEYIDEWKDNLGGAGLWYEERDVK